MLAFTAPAAQPETLDRVVASIGKGAVTQTDVEREYGFELFLQGKAIDKAPSATEFRAALDRLIGQTLLEEEMQIEAQPEDAGAESDSLTLASIQKKFATPADYQRALARLHMSEGQVQQRLKLYRDTLQFVDDRFRPQALPSESEIADYYQKSFVPEFNKSHAQPAPALPEVHDQIREIIAQQNINQLIDAWIKDLRQARGVKVFPD